ncbi:hypothetical protein JXJ21_12625 [candidate division KSB1 bacterium]|nr:hypothetical protein [candidate division KSB1 bacterium]
MKQGIFIISILILISLNGLCLAQVPLLLNYQGRLLDNANQEFTGNLEMTFYLYEDTTQAPIWSETQTVAIQSGIFHVLLGSKQSLEPSAFSANALFLGVKIGTNEEMKPRVRLTSVAYAINSDKLDGQDATNFANTAHTHDAVDILAGSGSGLDADLLDGKDSETFANTAHTHSADEINDGPGSELNADLLDGKQGAEYAQSTHTHSASDISAGPGSGLNADLLDGKNSTDFANTTHNHNATDINDGSGSGLDADLLDGKDSNEFLNLTNDAGRQGVVASLYEGTSTLTEKYVRKSAGTETQGITSSNSESTLSISNTGTGKALVATSTNIGVQSTASGQRNGTIYGIQASAANSFTSSNARATALRAEALNPAGGGKKTGLQAAAVDTGIAAYSTGVNSAAIYAEATSLTGTNYGILCKVNNTSSYAALFQGNVRIEGYITADNKSARVDVDGETYFLYCLESPEVWFEDFGYGQLKNGRTSIGIEPLYLKTISTDHDYHVFLTPLGNCNGLYVSQLGRDAFTVEELNGGTSNIRFSYRIVAKRKGYESYRLEKEPETTVSANDPFGSHD